MTEKEKPNVIILESDDAAGKHAESILSKAGWDVNLEQASSDALNTLARAENYKYALFISNYKLPKMAGDDILQKVNSISPLTQKMMWLPFDKSETLIKAINKAEINACIISPFSEEDLVYQAKNCFKQFKLALKKQQLKRALNHQNRQMLKIAQKLKQKDAAYKHLIDEKKAGKLMLQSKIGNGNKASLTTDICLSDLMEHLKISPAPDAFKKEFITLYKSVKELFDSLAARHHADFLAPGLKKILGRQNQENDTTGLIDKIIKTALFQRIRNGGKTSAQTDEIVTEKTDSFFEACFEVTLSKSETKAYIKKTEERDSDCSGPVLSDLSDLLKQKKITYGLLDDEAIDAWLSKSSGKKILIAKGVEPVPGCKAEIKFYFAADFTNPGKINEDGSIDFRDRGNIPFAEKGDLLAQKTLPQKGTPGISVSGVPIPVDEEIDPVFLAGPGTQMSEDGLSIHATLEGQPHLDALGTISVNPELVIPGDVDYETGNIDFKGNIIVKGMIKEGFIVKGINLTAQEIEGATIDLSGDLNISDGITEANISVRGNIYAKFINHSDIMGFGDLSISKEIIDSNILLSGSLQNSTGHIISSKISAKTGIDAGKIGTPSSRPAKLSVGVDDHIKAVEKQIDDALKASVEKSDLLIDQIKALENQDQELYSQITKKAFTQDQARVEIKKLKGAKKENNIADSQHVSKKIEKLQGISKKAEQELNFIFETQDDIAKRIDVFKNQFTFLEEKKKTLAMEKKSLEAFSKKEAPRAIITIAKTMIQDSIIKGPNSTLTLIEDLSHCKIQELSVDHEGIQTHEMDISDL